MFGVTAMLYLPSLLRGYKRREEGGSAGAESEVLIPPGRIGCGSNFYRSELFFRACKCSLPRDGLSF